MTSGSGDRTSTSRQEWEEFVDNVVLRPDLASAALAANPALLEALGPRGETPLHFLAVEGHETAVSRLIKWGAKVDAIDKRGNTALNRVALIGNDSMAGLLLASGADPNKANEDGETPLHAAAAGENPMTLGLLARAGGDLHRLSKFGRSPLRDCGLSEPEVLALGPESHFNVEDLGGARP